MIWEIPGIIKLHKCLGSSGIFLSVGGVLKNITGTIPMTFIDEREQRMRLVELRRVKTGLEDFRADPDK